MSDNTKVEILTEIPDFPGFYESLLDTNTDELDENFKEDIRRYIENGGSPEAEDFEPEFWTDFEEDTSRRMADVGDGYVDAFARVIRESGVKLKFRKIASPKFYNFVTDACECYLTAERETIVQHFTRLRPEIEKLLKKKFTSYDGFHSFFSPDIEDWEPLFLAGLEMEEEPDRTSSYWGAEVLLHALILEEEGEDFRYGLIERAPERVYSGEYVIPKSGRMKAVWNGDDAEYAAWEELPPDMRAELFDKLGEYWPGETADAPFTSEQKLRAALTCDWWDILGADSKGDLFDLLVPKKEKDEKADEEASDGRSDSPAV